MQDINPQHSLEELIHRLYPYDLILGDEGQKVVREALKVKANSQTIDPFFIGVLTGKPAAAVFSEGKDFTTV